MTRTPTLCSVLRGYVGDLFKHPVQEPFKALRAKDPALLTKLATHLNEECESCQDWMDGQEFPEQMTEAQEQALMRDLSVFTQEMDLGND